MLGELYESTLGTEYIVSIQLEQLLGYSTKSEKATHT